MSKFRNKNEAEEFVRISEEFGVNRLSKALQRELILYRKLDDSYPFKEI